MSDHFFEGAEGLVSIIPPLFAVIGTRYNKCEIDNRGPLDPDFVICFADLRPKMVANKLYLNISKA